MVWLILAHFTGDFLLNTRYIEGKKRDSPIMYLYHSSIIFSTVAVTLLLIGVDNWFKFAFFYMLSHMSIKVFMWLFYIQSVYIRLKRSSMDHKFYNKKVWMYWEDDTFYKFTGMVQLLHILTLFILWDILC